MTTVLVKQGSYLNLPVINKTFELVKDYKEGKLGGFITVRNDNNFPWVDRDAIRIKVETPECFEFVSAGYVPTANNVAVEKVVPKETDEEAMNRISTRFQIMDEMTKACIDRKSVV